MPLVYALLSLSKSSKSKCLYQTRIGRARTRLIGAKHRRHGIDRYLIILYARLVAGKRLGVESKLMMGQKFSRAEEVMLDQIFGKYEHSNIQNN
jgi:hypothetical protein